MSQIKGWPLMLHLVLLFFCIFKKTMLKMHKLHMKLRNIIFFKFLEILQSFLTESFQKDSRHFEPYWQGPRQMSGQWRTSSITDWPQNGCRRLVHFEPLL